MFVSKHSIARSFALTFEKYRKTCSSLTNSITEENPMDCDFSIFLNFITFRAVFDKQTKNPYLPSNIYIVCIYISLIHSSSELTTEFNGTNEIEWFGLLSMDGCYIASLKPCREFSSALPINTIGWLVFGLWNGRKAHSTKLVNKTLKVSEKQINKL